MGTILTSSLYTKPTDRNTLLYAKSYHLVALKKGLPISQLTRIKRICEDDDEFKKERNIMLSKFKERQYKEDWLCKAVKKVDLKSRDMLVNSKKKYLRLLQTLFSVLHIPQR